ncbi:MAG: amidohydrolase [Leptolyngbya sp. DLM2.Bin27]|nr:MAG: amidohydrolase [Leptolyngbya sp. DLM2.Bin27]
MIAYEAIEQVVEDAAPTIAKVAQEVWQLAELSLLEVQSSTLIMRVLEDSGFTITSRGTAGVPTAFMAECGEGEPKLGILSEYDALPGLGNEPVPCKQARKDGVVDGHGCGHNLIGAGAVGAAIALKNLMQAQSIPGTLRVYGCAAEETEGAKVYMAREGLFNDLDAALHWHPVDRSFVANVCTTATNSMKVEFFGTTAHAGLNPWLGRSAVDAAELFAHAVNLMREHIEPTARVHYVYESAGIAPNVVPDYAKVWLTCREVDRDRVNAITDWLRQMADGAALATQTKAKLSVYVGFYDLLPNQPLAERMQTYLERVGTPTYSPAEETFAKEIQTAFGVAETGMATAPLPLFKEAPKLGGSSDVGDVSYNTPSMGIGFATVPMGISMHTWAATACHGMSIGIKGAVAAAKVLAATGADLLTDPDLRAAARADFEQRTAGITYQAALDPDQVHPIGLPEYMIEGCQREFFAEVVSA